MLEVEGKESVNRQRTQAFKILTLAHACELLFRKASKIAKSGTLTFSMTLHHRSFAINPLPSLSTCEKAATNGLFFRSTRDDRPVCGGPK